MSLMMLGPVAFDMKLNPQKLSRSSEASFAVHEGSGFTPSLQLVRPSAGAGRDSRDAGAPASAPTRNGIEVVGGGFGGPTA